MIAAGGDDERVDQDGMLSSDGVFTTWPLRRAARNDTSEGTCGRARRWRQSDAPAAGGLAACRRPA